MSTTTSLSTPSELHCTKCDAVKPIDAFGKDKSRRYGKALYCKSCTRTVMKVIRKRNNEQRTDYNREYRNGNRDAYRVWERDNYKKRKVERLAQAKKWREGLGGTARMMYLAARTRAKKKSIDFDIDSDVIETMIRCQDERCALTGIPFEYSSDGVYRYRPFAPSLDRRDNTLGYTYGNIRIVCCIVNKARNEYPVEIFDMMCRARVEMLNAT